MRNWTIGKRLTLGFGGVVVALVVLGGYVVVQLATIRAASDRVVNDSLPGTAASGLVLARVKENLAVTLEHMLEADPGRMAELESQMAATSVATTGLLDGYEATITQSDDRALFDRIAPAREHYLAALGDAVALSRANRKAEALREYYASVAPAYRALEQAVSAVSQWNVDAGAAAGREIAGAVSTTTAGALAGLALATLLVVGVGVAIVRSTGTVLRAAVAELRSGAEQVTSASTQVASSSQSLSSGATEQAASLEETSASMEEMASMTRQNAENSRQAADLMQAVDGRVRDSNAALDEMVASMAAIKASSDKISRIIKTIDEIAFQTNILALNAAVEAARAGEAGMGFAVVADEVRNLAQRSAQAAKDTAGLIEESITRSTEGAGRVEQVAASTRGITDAVAEVKGLVDAVSAASAQQSQGIDQVSQAVAQMERVTQTTAATAEEAAAASEELNAQALSTVEVVRRLASLVGERGEPLAGAGTAGGRRTPGAAATIVRMPARHERPPLTPEQEIPLDGTGTFGSF